MNAGPMSVLYRLRRGPSRSLGERALKLLARPAIKLALMRDADPAVLVELGQRRLWMNWAHSLPSFIASYPHYETEIGRLAAFIGARDGRLSMIDVGANIGDTIALLPALSAAQFLCIEGSRKYFDLLVRNFGPDPSVRCVNALLYDGSSAAAESDLIERNGTAQLGHAHGPVEKGAKFTTLDAVIDQYPQFASANFLKIDTDGYDFRVLKGGANLLGAARPALHFELCFHLWEEVGRTDLAEALAWLAAAGYGCAILYDNLGYLIGTEILAKPDKLMALHDYAMRRRDFYLNIVAFHDTDPSVAGFLAAESERRYG